MIDGKVAASEAGELARISGAVVSIAAATKSRALRFSRRARAVGDASELETIPGIIVGAISSNAGESTITGSVEVNPYTAAGGALSTKFRFTKSKPIQGGTNYPDYLAVTGGGLNSTYGFITLAAEFAYDGATFEVLYKGQGVDKGYRVYVNGLLAAEWVGIAPDGSLRRRKITLPDARPRIIRIEGAGGAYLRGVASESTATVAYPTTTAKGPRLIVMGDSYTEGTGATTAFLGLPDVLSRRVNMTDTWASGSGGTGYLNVGAALTPPRVKLRDRVQTDVIAHNPRVVVIAAGVNDAAYAAADVGVEAGLLYDAILTGLPNVELLIVGPWWPRNSSTLAAPRVAIRDALKAAALARGLYFIDSIAEEWITGTGTVAAPKRDGNADIYISGDTTHPTDAGHKYLAERLAGHMLTLGM